MTATILNPPEMADVERLRPQVYLSGPMRGFPEFNFPAFRDATDLLEARGFLVYSPAEADLVRGFNPSGMEGTQEELDEYGFNFEQVLAEDLTWVCLHADMVVVLDGWENSTGAFAEVAAAAALGKPVMPISDFYENEDDDCVTRSVAA